LPAIAPPWFNGSSRNVRKMQSNCGLLYSNLTNSATK